MSAQEAPDGVVRRYRIFGIEVDSELPLPEAAPAASFGASADATLVFGPIPNALEGGRKLAPWLQVNGAACLLTFERLGRFLVEDGRRIVLEKHDDASFGDLRGYLFGSAFGALAHQRAIVPLHVSALAAPQGAIAFTGQSGAGKSTLGALLNQVCGWKFITDDVAALETEGGSLRLLSGVNTVKLWSDALALLGRESAGLRRDLTRFDKFHAVHADGFCADEAPLAALVSLSWGDALSLSPVRGRDAYPIALSAIYRPEFATLFGNRERVARAAMDLAARVPVATLVRPRGLTPQNARALTEEIAQMLETLPR